VIVLNQITIKIMNTWYGSLKPDFNQNREHVMVLNRILIRIINMWQARLEKDKDMRFMISMSFIWC